MLLYKENVQEILSKRDTSALCCVQSFGCMQNVSDGEKITGLLCSLGCGVTTDITCADIIIYNTCAVRESAELKVFGLIGELKHIKEKNPNVIIGVCGCMAQEEEVVQKIKKIYKQVDLIFGTFALEELPRLLYEVLTKHKPACATDEYSLDIPENIPVIRANTLKASVPIMNGCNNFCSYCIVPYVRGRERSRAPEAVLDEIKALAKSGYKEIMLLGQNVNSYGRGLEMDINFSGLLRLINDIDGDFKVRFMSSHPKDADFELIDTIASCDKVCKHLHLPLQSGSNRILDAMNRKYTAEKYLETVDYARKKMPDFSFSTDIIVGFPNETYEDFKETIRLLEYVKYDNVFSFIYSKRKGTKAALFEDSTSEKDKSLWLRELLAKQREIAVKRYSRFIGQTLDVLFDDESKTKGYVIGKSDEFIIVEAKTDDLSVIGTRCRVKITEAMNWALRGEILKA